MLRIFKGIFLLALWLVTVPVWAADITGPARVIDGDTLDINGTRIRLDSIDAPEMKRSTNAAATDKSPEKCRIKGNISSKGERIYHTPKSRWYSRTKISTSKGERWFCSEAEARKAGWRPPKR